MWDNQGSNDNYLTLKTIYIMKITVGGIIFLVIVIIARAMIPEGDF